MKYETYKNILIFAQIDFQQLLQILLKFREIYIYSDLNTKPNRKESNLDYQGFFQLEKVIISKIQFWKFHCHKVTTLF